MGSPGSAVPADDGAESYQMSEIIDSYDETRASMSQPSVSATDNADSTTKPLIEPQPQPPLVPDENGLSSAPLARRIRWDPNATPQKQRTGPTVTVRRAQNTNTPTRSVSGIQRRNHPGQINLAGLQPPVIPGAVEPTDPQNTTGEFDLDDEDNEHLATLADELGHLDNESMNSEALANETGQAVINPAAFLNVPITPSSDGGSDYGFGPPLGVTTPGESGSEGTFDPARDADLDHVDVIPGETDGMPRRRRRSWMYTDGNESGWSKLRRVLGIDTNVNDVADSAEKGTLGADATNYKHVPVHTSSGIRGGHSRPSRFERKASQLVRAHKMLGAKGEYHLPKINRTHLPDSEASTPDVLETTQNLDARPVPTSGVLGQLLKLHESEAQPVSASASPLDSIHDASESAGNTPVEVEPGSSTAGSRRTSMRPQSIYHSATNHAEKIGKGGGRVIKGVATEAGIDIDERPKAARSSAGVVGALLATTGNLIGAVSPNHAQLGPNPRRPGYTLDRYMLPELDEKTLRRTAKIVSDRGAPMSRDQAVMQSRRSMDTSNDSYLDEKSKPNLAEPPTKNGKRHFSHKLLQVPAHEIASATRGDYFVGADDRAKAEWARKLKKRRKQKKTQEIYITLHVAEILQRQEFLLKLARSLMMFGAPTHRIETQIQQTATVLDINCRCVYFPNLMLLSFGDDSTHTSETKIIKQVSVLDLTKLTDMHTVYWNVIHDKIGVDEASKRLDQLMLRRPFIRRMLLVIVGGFASGLICFGESGFGGSFLDSLVAAVLGAFLVFCQLTITTELYSNVFEIVFATLNSFVALAMHSIPSNIFCYKPIVSASIVLILPGFIVLSGALELQSKNIVSGSVRLVYAVIYSVLLGFGISIGSLPATSIENLEPDTSENCKLVNRMLSCDSSCHKNHWYTATGSAWFGFLTVPGYAAMLSLRNQAKFNRKEFPAMVVIACAGWITSHIHVLMGKRRANIAKALQMPYMTAAMGSFTVGILANIYGRIFDGRSFVVAVPGILFQLPTGLDTSGTAASAGTNGLLNGVKNDSSVDFSTNVVSNGFSIGEQLLSVALGITIGVFCSTIIMHILGGRKIRGGSMFSF